MTRSFSGLALGARWVLATVLSVCGGCVAGGPAPAVHAASATPSPTRAPEVSESADPADSLRESAVAILPDARLTARTPGAHGSATLEWRSLRLRIPLRANAGEALPPSAVFEAAAFLQELADAGAVLSRTSGRSLATEADGAIECSDDEESDEPRVVCGSVQPARGTERTAEVDLDPPAWMLPPSQRARPRTTGLPRPRRARRRALSSPTVDRIAGLLAHHSELRVAGFPLDEAHRLLLVTSLEVTDMPTGVLLCVADRVSAASRLDCTVSDIESLEGVVTRIDEGWLVVAGRTGGSPRDATRLLVSVLREGDGVLVDALELGGVSGDGEECEGYEGYCVYVRGVAHRARLLSSDCVERGPAQGWAATHVRIGDRWVDETLEPTPRCVDRFALRNGRFERAQCGADSSDAPCPAPAAADHE